VLGWSKFADLSGREYPETEVLQGSGVAFWM